MKLLTPLITAAALCLAGPLLAQEEGVLPTDQDVFTTWGETEGWTIYSVPTKQSCLLERVDANENVLQMGLTDDKLFGYLGVFTKSEDIDIKEGDEIVLSLDGNIYVAEAYTKSSTLPEGYSGGYILANSPEFVEDVQRRYDMIVFPEDDFAFIISLEGTFKAIEAARECQAEFNS